jgi:GTP-binding protein
VSKAFEFSGHGQTNESAAGVAGNIIGIAGFEDIDIGETLCDRREQRADPVRRDRPAHDQMFSSA